PRVHTPPIPPPTPTPHTSPTLSRSTAGAPYLVARHLQTAVINAGDGAHAHPTQALLDLYTIRNHLGDVRGRRVVIVGDIEHSRRSEEHTSQLQSRENLVCRLLLETK